MLPFPGARRLVLWSAGVAVGWRLSMAMLGGDPWHVRTKPTVCFAVWTNINNVSALTFSKLPLADTTALALPGCESLPKRRNHPPPGAGALGTRARLGVKQAGTCSSEPLSSDSRDAGSAQPKADPATWPSCAADWASPKLGGWDQPSALLLGMGPA